MANDAKKPLGPKALVTQEVRLSFPQLFKAVGMKGDSNSKLKFSCTLLIPPKTLLAPFHAAMKAAVLEKWGSGTTLPAKNSPIHDCATYEYQNKRYDGYDDGWKFIRVSSEYQPAIVDRAGVPVTDKKLVYGGMWVRAFINAYPWDYPAKGKGVGFGLNALQLVRDDEPFGTKAGGAEVFEPLEELAAAGDDDVDMFE